MNKAVLGMGFVLAGVALVGCQQPGPLRDRPLARNTIAPSPQTGAFQQSPMARQPAGQSMGTYDPYGSAVPRSQPLQGTTSGRPVSPGTFPATRPATTPVPGSGTTDLDGNFIPGPGTGANRPAYEIPSYPEK